MTNSLSAIFQRAPFHDENPLVLNFVEPSASANFYNEFYSDDRREAGPNEMEEKITRTNRFRDMDVQRMEEIVSFIERSCPSDAVVIELGGSRYQHRSANASKRIQNYFPVDIGYSNMVAYAKAFNKPGIVADATRLPFIDNSIDCVFTHTFLEHPLNPEMVVSEIARVLKPGGIVIHNDAWFCRWWQRYAIYGLRNFGSLTSREKVIWLAAYLSERRMFRLPPIIVSRFFRLLMPAKRNQKLRYGKLVPNYSLHLGCEEDAASRIDPIDVIRFYESRGFKLEQPLSFLQRLIYGNTYIRLRKSK